MTNTTCTELYNDMIENTYDLLCDICVIESLYRCRAQLPRFDTLPALSAEIWRTRCFLDQHAMIPAAAAACCSTALQRKRA